MKFLNQKEATDVDVELMSEQQGFSNDQLMELAGLAVADNVFKCFPVGNFPSILVVCGPGNNGGDGLVSARHLSQYGYKVTVLYPKKPKNDLFIRLIRQCENIDVEVKSEISNDFESLYSVIVDSIFGYSFKGSIRAPFDSILNVLSKSNLPILSVDVPSGWNIEEGPQQGCIRDPDVLISLTAPKLCAKYFKGRHFLGGRFVPKKMSEELDLPKYNGNDTIIELL